MFTTGENADEVYDALGHHLRRESIRFLEEQPGERTSVSGLVTHLEQRGATGDTERVRMQLHHAHLPKLDDLGWLDFESERGEVTYHGHEAAERVLSDMMETLCE
jgi:hypothetical protein